MNSHLIGKYITTDGIVVLTTTEGTAQTGDVAIRLVDGDYITSTDLLLGDRVNHLLISNIHIQLPLCPIHTRFPCL